MSGHSKWHTIKHKKGAADAKRGQQQMQQLLDGVTLITGDMAASRLGGTVGAMLLDPDRHKGLDIGRQFLPACGPLRLGELAKLPEQGHSTEDIPCCVAVLMGPRHIALNRLKSNYPGRGGSRCNRPLLHF